MKEINFNRFFKSANIFSLLLILISIFFLLFKGLNYGVDFKGGTLIELRVLDKNVNISNVRDVFNSTTPVSYTHLTLPTTPYV